MSKRPPIQQRLEKLAARLFKDYEVAALEYKAKYLDQASNSRLGIGAGNVARDAAEKAFNAMATKYLNDCSYSFVHPKKRISQFTIPATKLLEDMRVHYTKGRKDSQPEHVRLFEVIIAQAEEHLASVIDDVEHGEIGTQVLYRHVPFLQRQWNNWGFAIFLAVLGGAVGAYLTAP